MMIYLIALDAICSAMGSVDDDAVHMHAHAYSHACTLRSCYVITYVSIYILVLMIDICRASSCMHFLTLDSE